MRFSAIAGATLALAAACGGTNPGASPGPNVGVPAPTVGCMGSGGQPVGIANFAFNPQNVSVAVGANVTWTNTDTGTHTVTFDAGPDCGLVNTGQSLSRTFDTAGSFAYHCAIHTSMKGTVVVQ